MGRTAGVNAVHFLTVLSLITSVADAGAHYADTMSSTVDVNTLVGWHVALGTFPTTVALAASTRVLTVTAAQHRAGRSRAVGPQESWETVANPRETFTVSMTIVRTLHNRLYDDGIVGDLFCVSSIIVKRQVPDSSVQVLDEPSLMHIHGADMSGASLRLFFERTG